MAEANISISVEDVRKLALPMGTRVVAGDGLLQRPVTWAAVFYPENRTASKTIQRGEIVLVSPPENELGRQSSDAEIVRWAASMQAAAVVLSDNAPPALIAEANASGIPLMVLPGGSRIRLIEKAVVSLLIDRKGQLERRATQIYRQLTQISSRNEGMSELIHAIARLTNKAVVVQDKRLRIIESAEQPQFVGNWEEVENFLRNSNNLPVEMQDRLRVVEIDNPVQMQSLPTPGLARLISPIITKNIGRGFLSIIGRDNDLDDIDSLVAEHGAAACALEMAKAKAISDTEKRLRGTFLDRLLNGDVSQQEAIRQGERFDHDMTQSHIAVVLAWRADKIPSNRRLETTINAIVTNQHVNALVWQRERENEVVVFYNPPEEDAVEAAMELAKSFTQEIQRQYPGTRVAVGIGQPAQDIGSWRNSYRDAVQARQLAARLQTDAPLYIGSLGVYQLILSLSDREKLVTFCQATLGSLEDYDKRQDAELIKTLEAYFACHGNLSETAKDLIVHRNTLLYRVNRIEEIASIKLERPEVRLALHLALTIRRLLAMN